MPRLFQGLIINIRLVERYRRTTPDDLWHDHATFHYEYDNLLTTYVYRARKQAAR